jgi:protein O-mannosyl-transferase
MIASKPDRRGGGRESTASLAVCALLLLAIALVFGQTLRYPFVNYDDAIYVTQNRAVTQGLTWQGIGWAFTTRHASNWHPLTWLSHMLDCQWHGLDARWHHATNVLIHAATAIGLFLVLRRMTGRFWPSAFAAAVFAIHPLRVESVAWVAERKDVLSGLFFMLTLGAYAGYARRPFSLLRYLAVVTLFALGLMAKPMLVTLPFVLLLLDYWPLGRVVPGTRRVPSADEQTAHGVRLIPLVVEKLPLFALAAASSVITPLAQGQAVATTEILPIAYRTTNAVVSYVSYLGQFFYPVGLSVFYPHQEDLLAPWKVVCAAMLLLGVSATVVVCWRRFPYLLVGWFWYLGMLVPVVGLVQVGGHSLADRYTYLPQIGLSLALTWCMAEAVAARPWRGWACGVLAALAVAALMGCAWRQTTFWRDSFALWHHALACDDQNSRAYGNLASLCYDRGQLEEAAAHYQSALRIKPGWAEARTNLGNALLHLGRVDEAIGCYQTAIESDRAPPDSFYNLANALAGRGQNDEATAFYRKTLEMDPRFAYAHYGLGNILAGQKRFEEAVAEYREGLAIRPNDVNILGNLGTALVFLGRLDEGVAAYRQALQVQPNFPGARKNLEIVLRQQERIRKALAEQRSLLHTHPDDVGLLNDLAWLLATNPSAALRNGVEAVALARQAAELSGGNDPAVLGTLAAAYAEAGRFAEAVQTARKALDLAGQQNKPSLVESIKTKIPVYESRKAYRATN